MIRNYGFIFLSPGADPVRDRHEMSVGDQRTTLVAIGDPSAGVPVAKELADDGCELLELCGAFGPVWTARIIEAVGDGVVVGAVAYGAESVDRLAALTAGD